MRIASEFVMVLVCFFYATRDSTVLYDKEIRTQFVG